MGNVWIRKRGNYHAILVRCDIVSLTRCSTLDTLVQAIHTLHTANRHDDHSPGAGGDCVGCGLREVANDDGPQAMRCHCWFITMNASQAATVAAYIGSSGGKPRSSMRAFNAYMPPSISRVSRKTCRTWSRVRSLLSMPAKTNAMAAAVVCRFFACC